MEMGLEVGAKRGPHLIMNPSPLRALIPLYYCRGQGKGQGWSGVALSADPVVDISQYQTTSFTSDPNPDCRLALMRLPLTLI